MELFFIPVKRSVQVALLSLATVASLVGGKPPAPVMAAPASAPEPEIVQAPFYTPVAQVDLTVPADVMVGEDFTFTATFVNTSGVASDVGYGPFIDIVFPVIGVDGAGAATDDGADFLGATYLGASVTAVQNTFGAANTGGCSGGLGPVTHPYAVAPTTGDALVVCGVPGNKLVVLQLPFGSFVPGQPPAAVNITASLSNLADVGSALTIRARGGYQYGATPLNDWCCDPFDATILSHPSTNSTTWPDSPVTPRLFTTTKAYNGPEDETATGPNFLRPYTITVDVADGQTLTNLDVSDILPNNMQFVAFVSSSPASTAISTPSTSTPGGTLTRRFASVTGGPGEADATMTFSFYIPRLNSGGGEVINPVTGAPATSVNEAQATANWTPIDPRDAAAPVTGICGTPCHTLTDRSIATQKSVVIVNDVLPTGYSSGDTLEYTLDFQVSDFFAFDDVTLTDVLSDGQHLDLTSAPTLAVNGNGYAFAAAPIDVANYDEIRHWTGGPAVPTVNGTTELVFRVSDELVSRGRLNGRLIGGCIDPVTGSSSPDCAPATYDNDATTGMITFRAQIQQNFTDDYPSGDPSVDHGDVLENALTITGDVLDRADSLFPETGSIASDGSAADATIAFGALSKGVYAINGVVCDPCTAQINAGIKPGDTVTFRLRYTQPASNFEETVITDYLPLPVFNAAEVTNFDNSTACSVPVGAPLAGHGCLGPADSFHTLTTPVPPAPTLSTNGTANTVSFSYPDYDNTSDIASEIDLLFTVTVTDEPFADGLFLTNQAHVAEGTTNATPTVQDAIIQIKLNEPALYTTKAAVSTDNPNGIFTPSISTPISFNAPGTGGLSWSGGIISSNYLDAHPINSNLGFVDAGDLVRFAIVVYNEGHSQKGAFDISIRDTLQPGYVIPGGPGLNLQIYRGDELPLTYTDLGGGIFGNGIKIDDPGAPGIGACQAHDATNGRNIIIITYDLQLRDDITLDQGIINTATLFNYAGTPGGPDFTNPLDLSDTATVQPVTSPVKSIKSTSEAHTSEAGTGATDNPRLAAVGEIIRFRIEESIPEGTVTNFRLHDELPDGLIFLNDNTTQFVFVSTGGNISSTTLGSASALNAIGNETTVPAITPGLILIDTAISETDSTSTANYAADDVDDYVSGDDIFFKFGTVTNPDRDSDNEYVIVEFNALIANVSANNAGVNRDNSAAPRYGSSSGDGAFSPIVRVRVVEPSITFNKTIVSLPSPLDAGGVVQYRLSFANGTGANASGAFDVHLTDTLPAQLALDLASINVTLAGGAAGVDTSGSLGNNLVITIASVPRGGIVTVDYSATILDIVTPAEIITNTSTSTWTSLPGGGTSPNATGSTAGAAGGTTGERTGSGISPNTYTATSSRNFTIASPPALIKQLTATSASHTSGANVAIGEEVTYDILLTFPEGTTLADTVVDDLPAGLEVTGTPEVITTAADSGGLLTADFYYDHLTFAQNIIVTPGDGGGVTFEFTNVTVNGDNITTNNTLLMRFRARATNIAANIAGATISNSATNRVGSAAPTASNTVTVTVVEPSITLGKTIESLPTPLDAGGVVHYRITYANGTGANVSTAMDVNITDALAAALLLPSTTAPDIVITATAGVGAITNNSTTSNINIVVASVPPGESVTVDFYPVIQNTVTPGQIIDNVGNSTWTSLSGAATGERTGANGPTGSPDNYAAVSNAQFTMPLSQSITKQLTTTSASHTAGSDVAIGEEITYDILLTFPEGLTPLDTVVDDLPLGLEIVAGTPQIITTAAASGGLLTADFNGTIGGQTIDVIPGEGGSVTFRFTDVSLPGDNNIANNTILLRFRALVLNVNGNQNAGTLSNAATNQVGTGTPTISNVVRTTIVEPVLNVTKQATDGTPAVGEVLTFTLLLSHDPASPAAFDVILTDDVPVELALVSGSFTATPEGTGTVTNLQTNQSGNHLEVTADSLEGDARIRVTYRATVVGSYNSSFQNDAIATWTSLPGIASGERNGSDIPTYNDYHSADQATINVTRALVKSLVASNVTSTSPDHIVTIGEILTYQVVLTIPAGSTDLAIVTDTLDSGLAFVDCAATAPVGATQMHDIIAGSHITSSNFAFVPDVHGNNVASCNHGTNALLDNPYISNSGGTIRLDLGNISNTSTAPETITLTYRVIVLDVGANVQNVTLDNDVDWTWARGTLGTRATPSLRIIEPDLQIEKTVDPEVAAFGSVVTYTIEIQHTMDSLTTAYDVLLTDGIPTGLILDEGSVTVTGSATLPATVITTSPTQFSVYWSHFPLGATATVTFEAEFMGPSPVFNTANVEWSSLQIDPAPRLQPQSAYNRLSTERRYDPLDQTVNDYAVSSTIGLRVPRLPKTGFAPGRVTILPEQPTDFSYNTLGGLWLEIPRLKVKVGIVGVPFNNDGWNLTWLGSQAGYLDGTAYPTHAGNSGITAHAYLADGSPGPFVDLNKLSYGDQIIVHMDGQRYIYEVRANQLVRPNDLSVLKHEEYPWLTLLTCRNYNEYADEYQFRVSVRAVLVKVENE